MRWGFGERGSWEEGGLVGGSDTGDHVHDPQIRVRPMRELQREILFEGMVVRKCRGSRHLDVDDLRGRTGRTTVRPSSSRACCGSATVRCSIGREDRAALCPHRNLQRFRGGIVFKARCGSSCRASSMGPRGLEDHATVDPRAGSSFRASIGPTARSLCSPEVSSGALKVTRQPKTRTVCCPRRPRPRGSYLNGRLWS